MTDNQNWKPRDSPHNELLRSQSAYSYFASCNMDDENNHGIQLDETVCFMCRNIPKTEVNSNSCKRCGDNNNASPPPINNNPSIARIENDIRRKIPVTTAEANTTPAAYSIYENRKPCRSKRIDVITSFTDSPLFSRKYRFGRHQHQNSAQNRLAGSGADKGESNSFNLVKHIAEARWKRKDTKNNVPLPSEDSNSSVNSSNIHSTGNVQNPKNIEMKTSSTDNNIEATPIETRSSVSLQTQVNYVIRKIFCLIGLFDIFC